MEEKISLMIEVDEKLLKKLREIHSMKSSNDEGSSSFSQFVNETLQAGLRQELEQST